MSSPADAPDIRAAEAKTNWSRSILFLLLIIATSLPLVFPTTVPNKPSDPSLHLYSSLMSIKDGSTVLIQSDWTNSTRGENGGEFEALLRILMRKSCKLAIYSVSDPQAPQVARDVITRLNNERKKEGDKQYEKWNDYVVVGFFPNAEGMNNAMAGSLRTAWNGKKDVGPDGQLTDVFKSPVLANVKLVSDASMLVMVTGTNSFNIVIERLFGKVPLCALVTGVMAPESQVYYASGQITGLAAGLKGVYDLETMMENGVNLPGVKDTVVWAGHEREQIPNFPGKTNFQRGGQYYPTLHFALGLLILAVFAGNIGMVISRRRNPR